MANWKWYFRIIRFLILGRLNIAGDDIFTLKDRHKHQYILAPVSYTNDIKLFIQSILLQTHEETATELLSSLAPISYKHFPLRLYQISSKFRDERRPRYGLMRAREFLMKDMYSFDVSIEKACQTYEDVCNAYDNIFEIIGVDFIKGNWLKIF